METVTNAPICKTQICKRPLTYLEEQGCWRCLNCNPIPKDVPKPKEKKKFLDVKMTEEQVAKLIEEKMGGQSILSEKKIREIVVDELENWHIQRPPITAEEAHKVLQEINGVKAAPSPTTPYPNPIAEATGVGGENVHISVQLPKPETYMQKAKRLGVATHKEAGGIRKKAEVLADIEAAEKIEESPSEGQ